MATPASSDRQIHLRLPGALYDRLLARARAANSSLSVAVTELLTAELRSSDETRYLLLVHSHLLSELLSLLLLDDPTGVQRTLTQAEARAAGQLNARLLPVEDARRGQGK